MNSEHWGVVARSTTVVTRTYYTNDNIKTKPAYFASPCAAFPMYLERTRRSISVLLC
jgi:hypothetical protein